MIVVAGEALIDLTRVDIDGQTAYVPHPGGSPYNVAMGLGRLRVPVAFLGRLSVDRLGRLLRDHLVDSDVDLALVVDGEEPTTLAFVHVGDGEPEYAFYAQQTADRLLVPADLRPLPDGAALHLGSISLVLEPGASTLDGLLRAESRQRMITLDPNIRADLITDQDAFRRRFDDWVGLVDVVKVSVVDLQWLVPDGEPAEVAAAWIARGTALVLVTAGAEGSYAFTAEASAHAAGARVDVVDTVGAGDAFTSGALAHLHDSATLTREGLAELSSDALLALLTAANAVAADTCTRPGADPPRR